MTVANSPEQFLVDSIILTSERFGDREIDITTIVETIEIFENINMPYLTGNMLVFDDNDLYSRFNILGTERIRFTFSSAIPIAEVSAEKISKTFIISSVQPYKHNDNVSLLYCEIIEEHGYVDQLIKFSKSFTGIGEDIISNIVEDQLGKKVDKQFEVQPGREVFQSNAFQGEMKYIVPYISPLEAASNVTKRLCTTDSLPFFLYSSLYQDELVLTDLGSILRRTPFNEKIPFIYSQGETINSQRDLAREMFVLNSFQSGTNEDTLTMAQLGGIGSELFHLDFRAGRVNQRHIKATDAVQQLVDANYITQEQSESLIDDRFIPQPDKTIGGIDQYKSAIHVLPTFSPYGNTPSLSEAQSTVETMLRVQKRGMLSILAKNMYTISGPGMIFTVKDPARSVGNQINMTILSNKMINSETLLEPDNKRSGYFIITAKKYHFDISDQLCRYTLECARLANRVNTR